MTVRANESVVLPEDTESLLVSTTYSFPSWVTVLLWETGMVRVARQVGVPLSLEKVMSGALEESLVKVSWTQPSFRFFSLEAGDVIVMVVVTS